MSSFRIPMFDYRAHYRAYRAEIDAALAAVLEEGTLLMGEEVRAFEEEFAAYCGARFAYAVHTGTEALHFALRAVGIGPGDEVITAPNSDIATALAVEHCGATVRWVDIDLATYNLDVSQLEDAITPQTRAVIPVHMYGLCADMDPVREIAERHDLWVVEDAALACGATYRERHAGSLGDAAGFSVQAGKVLGGLGAGGMVTTDDPKVARRVNSLRYYGRAESPYRKDRNPAQSGVTVRLGFNSRMDTLQCAALRVFLRHHEEIVARRRAAAGVYDERLAGTRAVLPVVPPGSTHVYRVYVVLVPDRDRVLHQLHERGVQAGLHYVPPNHLHPYYRRQGHRPGEFPVAERVADDLLCLPCHPYMTTAQAEEVADTLRALIVA